jgi:hypothetical protein
LESILDLAAENHREALADIGSALRESRLLAPGERLAPVGHRVVHGGEAVSQPMRIDAQMLDTLRSLIALAPLHNPANILGIEASLAALPDVPQVAVFDTAFHQSMPPHDFGYAVPEEWYRDHGVRRYGFHGTSHRYAVALARIAEVSGERAELARERDIVRRKRALQQGGGSFERQGTGAPAGPAKLAAELEEIEGQLAALGTDADLLHAHLDINVDVLSHCDKQLWIEDTVMMLDRMNIKRDARDTAARSITLQELNNPRGPRAAVLFVSLDPSELPRRQDLLAAALLYSANAELSVCARSPGPSP